MELNIIFDIKIKVQNDIHISNETDNIYFWYHNNNKHKILNGYYYSF